jgi:hypothetical protein
MNVFTQNNRYYNLPKYLLFLLKHPVYTYICMYEEPWWSDIDREKYLIHPPDLCGIPTSRVIQ